MLEEIQKRISALSEDRLKFCLMALLLTQHVTPDLMRRTLDLCDGVRFEP